MPTMHPRELFADEAPTKLTPMRVTERLGGTTRPGRTRERHDTRLDETDSEAYGNERPEPVEFDVGDFVKTLGVSGRSACRQQGTHWWTLCDQSGFQDTTTDPAVVDVWCTERVLL